MLVPYISTYLQPLNSPFQLINNPQFSDLLTGEDETALQYLKNLTVEEYEDSNSGYKISFVG